MRMSDFVAREAINPDLAATTKEGAIREMVDSLRASGHIKSGEHENIIKAIMKRESLGSTGIGRGVAIPHSKHESVDRLVGTVAISQQGIPFDSLDREPVHILILLISPENNPREHLRALESVSRNLKDDMFCRFLRQAASRDAVWDLLQEVDHAAKA